MHIPLTTPMTSGSAFVQFPRCNVLVGNGNTSPLGWALHCMSKPTFGQR